MPFIEQTAVFGQLNFSMPLWGTLSGYFGDGGTEAEQIHFDNTSKLALTPLSIFMCPSEPGERLFTHKSGWSGYGSNYVVNSGTGTGNYYDIGTNKSDGLYYIGANPSMASFVDGTSNTVAFSEVTHGIGLSAHTGQLAPRDWKGYMLRDTSWATSLPIPGVTQEGLYTYAEAWTGQWRCDRTFPWISGRLYVSGFQAFQLPNDKSPDYWNGPNNGFYAARSSHTGGVNAGLGDGSVRFVNETINLEAWRAVNTIRGGETASF